MLNCKALNLDVDTNCLNTKASCFKPDKTAPYLAGSTPAAGTLQSLLGTIQLDFSEELKDATDASHYAFSGAGTVNLSIASVQRLGSNSVIITTKGKVASGQINLHLTNLTDYGGNALTGTTVWSITGNVQIPIKITSTDHEGVSNLGGGYASLTAHWNHEYDTDANNEYAIWVTQQPQGSQPDCTPFWNNKATNPPLLSGSPIAANADQTANFTVSNFAIGWNQILICVRNLGQNKFGGLAKDIVRDDTRPSSVVSPGTSSSGNPLTVSLTCTDNADQIAYTVDGGVPAFSGGVITTGSLYTGPWSVPNDATTHTLRWLCIDKGGNTELSAGSAQYLYDPSLPTVSLGTITRVAVSNTGGYASTQISWSADQSPRTYSFRKDGTCSALTSDLVGGTNVSGIYTGGPFTTTIPASALTAGVNQIRLCVYNAAVTNPGFVTFNITRDDTAPLVTAANVLPADAATNIAGSAVVTVNFPETMDATTLTSATNCSGSIGVSSDNFTTCLAGTLNLSSNPSVTFTPTSAFAYLAGGGRYKVRVTNAAKDTAGNPVAATYTQATGFTVAVSMLRRYAFDGGSLIDLTNSGYDFTTMNNPTTVTGADGDTNGAYTFNAAATQHLIAPDTGLPAGAAPRTLCAWAKPNSYPVSPNNTVFAVYGNFLSTNDRFGIGQRNFGNVNQLCMWVDNINRCANYTIPLKSWSHVCGLYDGANISLYANGVRIIAPTAVTLNTALSSLRAGVFFDLTSPYDGALDDIRIYNGALTQNDIMQLAVQVPSGLMAYYPFSDAGASPTFDASGNARNGTLVSGPTASADYFSAGNFAYTFSGSQRIASATPGPMPANAGAIAAWVRWSGNPGINDQMVVYNGNSGSKGFGIMLHQTATYTHTLSVLCGGVGISDFGYQLRAGDWMHLVLQATSAGNWQLFVNGTNVYTGGGCAMALPDTGQVTIGNNEVPDRPFLGEIDDVRVYNRALTTAEISTLAAQQTTALVRQYAFASGGLNDSASGGYALTATGSPAAAKGIDGDAAGAFRFDASTNYLVSTQLNQLPLGNNARTLCAWINPATYTSGHYTAMSYGGTTGSDPQGLAVETSNGYASYHYAAGLSLIPSVSVPINTWSHLCGTYDGSTLTMYLNGQWIGQNTPGTLTTTAGQFQIASWAVGGGSAFAGKIDDVRVYYGALSAPQIRSAGILVPSGLVAYLPFTARTVTDDSGNGHSAVYVGGLSTSGSVTDRFNFTQNAYTFNGSSHALKAPDSNLPSGLADSTQCVWVRPKAYPASATYAGLLSYGTPAAGRRRGLLLYNNAGTQQVIFSGYANDLLVNYTIPLYVWTHVCGVLSGGDAAIYVNGARVSSSQAMTWTTVNSGGIWIGSGQQPTETHYFNGDLDEVRIYNRALSVAELQTLSGVHPMQVSAPAGDFRLHMQAENHSNLANGTPISSAWFNSARNSLGNATASGSPTLASGAGSIGGRETVSFNGSTSYFDFGNPTLVMNGLTLCGVYSVAATASVWGGLLEKRGLANCPSGGNPSALCSFAWLQVNGSTNTKFETSENTTPTPLAASAGAPVLGCFVASGTSALSAQFQAGNSLTYGPGGSVSLGNNATNTDTLTLGKRSIVAEYFNGKIGDLLLFTSPLSTADRQLVECYLSSRYSLPLASGVSCP